MQEHERKNCLVRYGHRLLRGSGRFLQGDSKELAELPRSLGRVAPFYLVEDVPSRSISGLDHVVILPFAVHAYVLTPISQKVLRRSGCTFVLIFVLAPCLSAHAFPGFNLAKPRPAHTRHRYALANRTVSSGRYRRASVTQSPMAAPALCDVFAI